MLIGNYRDPFLGMDRNVYWIDNTDNSFERTHTIITRTP